MQTSPKRILWADMLRILGVLMVIAMHAGDQVVFSLWGKAPFKNDAIPSWWLTGVAYKSLVNMCVPLLFMLSGYLLLSARDDILPFFKKRLPKILIPLFAWTVLYLWWDGAFAESASFPDLILLPIKSFLANSGHFHLWFLYALLGLYLVTPILRRFVQSASDMELLYAIGIWFAASFVFELFSHLTGYGLALFAQPYISGFLGYYLAGYYLGRREYSAKTIWFAVALVILSVAGKTLWAYSLTADGGKFDTNLFDYLKWHVVLLSLAGFIAFKCAAHFIEQRISPSVERILVTVSKATFGIYLVHIMVLKFMNDGIFGFRLYTDSFHPLLAIPATALIAFIISFAIIYPLQKIPLLKKIVP